MSACIERLAPSSFQRQPWKNGGGVSTTIAGQYNRDSINGDWSAVIWQFSRTPIIAEGPFSDLSGFDRVQMVVKGSGLVLETPAGAIDLRSPFTPVSYDGGLPVVSRLESGPVEVANLIARRGVCSIDLQVFRGGLSNSLPEATHVLYAPIEDAIVSIDGVVCAVPTDHAVRFEARCDVAVLTGIVVAASITLNG